MDVCTGRKRLRIPATDKVRYGWCAEQNHELEHDRRLTLSEIVQYKCSAMVLPLRFGYEGSMGLPLAYGILGA